MNILKLPLLVSFLTLFLNADINKDLHIAFATYKYDTQHVNMIKSVATRTINEIAKELNINIHPYFPANEKEELKEFISYENNIIITHTSTYLENKELFKSISKNLFSFDDGKEFTQFYLIVNKHSKIKNIRDLKNKEFVTFKGNNNYSIWLDYITLKKLNTPYKKLIGNVKTIKKDSSLLLNIFFNKSDFSIISKKAYEDMLQLNPSLKNQIKIIEKSEPIFTYAIGFIHKKAPKTVVDKLNEMLDGNEIENRFKYLLAFINRTNVRNIEFKELEKLESFYSEYMRLKNDYIKKNKNEIER